MIFHSSIIYAKVKTLGRLAPIMASSWKTKAIRASGVHQSPITHSAREKFSYDLDMLFEAALVAVNFTAALRAKELIGKERGFFKDPQHPPLWSLDSLSDDDLGKTVSVLEERLSFSKKEVKKDA